MKKYTILKNWHYAFFLFGRLFGWHYNTKEFVIGFRFSKECWWYPPRNINDNDLNKLIGLSFGNIHKNSVRLSWSPNFEKEGIIKLYGYTYDESIKEHNMKYFCEVKVENDIFLHLLLNDDKYVFRFMEKEFEMENKTKDGKIQKNNYPYFGGNNKSPNIMKIWASIKKKDTKMKIIEKLKSLDWGRKTYLIIFILLFIAGIIKTFLF